MPDFAKFCQKACRNMLGKSPNQNQTNLFRPILKQIVNPRHELVLLSAEIDWSYFEKEFSSLYSNTGQPSLPVRMSVGLLILKQLYDLGDETVVDAWIQNPYFQYFCGSQYFQWEKPCDPSDLVHFRKRIGEAGVQKIFKQSVNLHSSKVSKCNTVLVDTTVQEKNITYPTDVKLHQKIIKQCNEIADDNNLELRQSYKRTTKKLLVENRFSTHPKRKKKANKAKKKLRTIAGRLTRDVERKLLSVGKLDYYKEKIDLFYKILAQKKSDKNKIYSIHEPEVSCIAKGKVHKPYEFGTKTSIAALPKHNIIVGVACFKGNPHDSKTLDETLNHVLQICNKEFKKAAVDRGYRGNKYWNGTEVIIPGNDTKLTKYQRREKRKTCKSRAAIEPIIGNMKSKYRLGRNYLKGFIGDQINALMAAASINFKSRLRELKRLYYFIFIEQNIVLMRLSS